MEKVTLSPKYQIVIPKSMRKSLSLKPGQKLILFKTLGGIKILPESQIEDMLGAFSDMKNDFEREDQQI